MRNDPDTPTPGAPGAPGASAAHGAHGARDATPGAPAAHPDPNATGSPAPLPGGAPGPGAPGPGAPGPGAPGPGAPGPGARGRETQEREAARRRGRDRRVRGEAGHDPAVGRADPALARLAFAALAENVRDYAIFLMDPDGIIRFWGEGARLIKWWTQEEAEGAHLRLLYPDGGAEDGTAEDHLADAAAKGESVGEGQRVRADGSTFWARVTLTALRADDGRLLGFAKTTIDRTAQRAADAARILAARAAELEAARGERADLIAEAAVLAEELAVLRAELAARDRAGA